METNSNKEVTTLMATIRQTRLSGILDYLHLGDVDNLPSKPNSYDISVADIGIFAVRWTKVLLTVDETKISLDHGHRKDFYHLLQLLSPVRGGFAAIEYVRNLLRQFLGRPVSVSEILTLRTYITPVRLANILLWFVKNKPVGPDSLRPSSWLKIYHYDTTKSGRIVITFGIDTNSWGDWLYGPSTLLELLGWD